MKRKEIIDILFRTFVVVASNTLLSIATVWFLKPANLYAGGATGLAQLVQGIITNCGGEFNLGWLIFIINVPIVLIGFKYVSFKFAIYSVLAVAIQSLVTGILEIIPFSPFEMLADPIVSGTSETMNYGGILTLALFGGLLAGISSGLALRYGVSTGGIDVISQALALHKNISLGNITMIINICIAVIGGGIVQAGNWCVVLFTIVRMILNSLVMDKIHTSYTYTSVQIFASNTEEIAQEIMSTLKRGCTLFDVHGAYTHQEKTEIYCVASTYEVEKILKIVEKYDSHAFVTLSPVKKVMGRFIKKTII